LKAVIPSRLPGRENSTPTMIAFDCNAARICQIISVKVSHEIKRFYSGGSTYLHCHDQGQRFRVLEQDLPWVSRLAQRVQSSLLQSGRLGIGDDLAILDVV
jgi:hypothetical protein